MTIAEIVRNGRGCAGSERSWRVERDEHMRYERFTLWHYRTPMLSWRKSDQGVELLDCSIGHGSVSDQGGMNTAFKVLGLPYRFDRDYRGGGPRITELVRGANGYYVRAEVRAEELRTEITEAYRLGRDPQRQLCELECVLEMAA